MTEEERRDEAIKQAGAIERISTCHPVALYFQRNAVTDDSHYFLPITAPHQKTAKAAFRPDHVATPAQFDVRLLSIMAGAPWNGNKDQLSRVYGHPSDRVLRDPQHSPVAR